MESVIRNEFGNQGSIITAKDVETVRSLFESRQNLWSHDELSQQFANTLDNKSEWEISSNFEIRPSLDIRYAIDHNYQGPKVHGRLPRQQGDAITIELPKPAMISQVILDSTNMTGLYSLQYSIEFSLDGDVWETAVENNAASDKNIEQTLGRTTKFIRITNHSVSKNSRWAITEIDLTGHYLN